MTTKGSQNRFPSLTVVGQASDPATPGSGDFKLFVADDGTFYLMDDTGTKVDLTASGGFTNPMTTAEDIIYGGASGVPTRKAKGSNDTFLGVNAGALAYRAVTDALLSTSDITTNDASTSKHGFLKKLDGNAAHYLDGSGAFSTPSGGAAGALVLLEQHTASSSATLDFTSFISSTYDEYMLELLQLVPATDNVNLNLLAGTGGGPTYDTGGNYASSGFRWSNTGSAVAGSGSGTAFQLDASGGIDNGAGRGFAGTCKLYLPQSTSPAPGITWHGSYTDNANSPLGVVGQGRYNGGSAMTAVQLKFSSGNIAGGTARVYGVAK